MTRTFNPSATYRFKSTAFPFTAATSVVVDAESVRDAVGMATANLDTQLGTTLPNFIAGSTKLAADGLDAITATEPTGKPTTFRGWLMWLVQVARCGSQTATTKLVKTEAGATVTTQAVSDNGVTEVLGPPT